jgi:hypothetical protein
MKAVCAEHRLGSRAGGQDEVEAAQDRRECRGRVVGLSAKAIPGSDPDRLGGRVRWRWPGSKVARAGNRAASEERLGRALVLASDVDEGRRLNCDASRVVDGGGGRQRPRRAWMSERWPGRTLR